MAIDAFAASQADGLGRLIGLDLGTKTIGIAVSDGTQSVASARETLARKKFGQDAAHLLALAHEIKAVGFVIGWPVNMDGSIGPRAQATGAFIRNMATKTDLPFVTWDERLSTVAAERAMLEADMSRAKRAERIDAAAAAHILQGALDRLGHMRVARRR
ncbi:MAG: Holliday junction resolvase RuvX [Pseudomonadota bacterium]